MTFQDRKTMGMDWEKVKNKRKMMHITNAVQANNPKGIFRVTDSKELKK
ncbi:hypothetical protein [Pelobium manganitolerans]|nr:hypothetical protein [Pelobium manganitolerans]